MEEEKEKAQAVFMMVSAGYTIPVISKALEMEIKETMNYLRMYHEKYKGSVVVKEKENQHGDI